MKSHRYGFALRYVKLSSAGRYLRMLAIWAIGMWLFLSQGLAVAARGLDRGLSESKKGSSFDGKRTILNIRPSPVVARS